MENISSWTVTPGTVMRVRNSTDRAKSVRVEFSDGAMVATDLVIGATLEVCAGKSSVNIVLDDASGPGLSVVELPG